MSPTGNSIGWIDLQPNMQLRVENAYYRLGAPKHGLDGYLGTEIAHYRTGSKSGLHLLSVEAPLKDRPADQPPVRNLIPKSQLHHLRYRLFYAVVFRRKGNSAGSALLGAPSIKKLEELSAQLLKDPDSICGPGSKQCVVFPQACSTSAEIEVTVNGALRTVLPGSQVASVVTDPKQVHITRKAQPIDVLAEPLQLHTPLFPGDRVDWE